MADSDYNGGPLIAIVVLFLVLTIISVALRFYVRLRITRAFQLDDWFMVASQLNFMFDCAFLCIGVHYGLGRHNGALSTENRIEGLKYQALATLGYVANMMFIKLSIAFFLLRIAVERGYVWTIRITMFVVAVWSIAIFIFDLFQCKPIAAQWDMTIPGHSCVPGDEFAKAAYSISVMTIVTDWLFALLPIPIIWRVQMTTQTKITVLFILSLGVFASVATLIRLKYIVDLVDVSDVLYTGTVAMTWTVVEPGVAITAASLVTIRPLLRSLNFKGFESANRGSARARTFNRRNDRANGPAELHDLNLRNDLSACNWTSIVDSGTDDGKKGDIGRGLIASAKGKGGKSEVREEDLGGLSSCGSPGDSQGSYNRDAGSQEHIMADSSFAGIGVRRTVDIRVEGSDVEKGLAR